MAILDTKDDIKDALNDAEKHFKPYFEPLDEFERLARNKPHPSVLKARLPSVTDGTLAAVVQAQPRRIIQQLPTGRVQDPLHPELALLADFIWTEQILPHACTNGEPLQKAWIASTKAKTFGSQPSHQFFNNTGEYYGGDFVLPYIKDVLPEPGKLNANDSNVVLMISWWTKNQVKRLIEREKLLKRRARERGELYESTWNLRALAELLDELQPKDEANKTANERQNDRNVPYAKLVHAFQLGRGASFFTYSPKLDKLVRARPNPDPRGCIPVKYLYDNLDLSNPLGRGAIELSGGMQNLLDSEVQRYQWTNVYNMQPALMKWGNVNKTQVKWKPNHLIDMGNDQNAKLEPLLAQSRAITDFPRNYGLMKSQILNLTNNQDTSISAESGNPSFSKTQAGVNAQQERIAVDDNYFRKQFETWFEAVAEDMLNIHFAESSGVREIKLTEEFLKRAKFNKDFTSEFFSVDGNTAVVLYDAIKTELRFKVDASTTQLKDDNDQKERLVELLELETKFPGTVKRDPLIQRIVTKLGIEDPEELLFTPEEREQQADEVTQRAPGAEETMTPTQAPAQAETPATGPQLAPEDKEIVDMMIHAGFDEEQIDKGLVMLHSGYSAEEIVDVLTRAAREAA